MKNSKLLLCSIPAILLSLSGSSATMSKIEDKENILLPSNSLVKRIINENLNQIKLVKDHLTKEYKIYEKSYEKKSYDKTYEKCYEKGYDKCYSQYDRTNYNNDEYPITNELSEIYDKLDKGL